MTAEELRLTHSSFWEGLQYVGYKSKKIPAIIQKRNDGGIVSLQMDGPPLTGKVVLSVTMGGLRSQEIPSDVKKFFKKELAPILVENFSGFDLKNSVKIVLRFDEGILKNFELAS